MGETGGGGCDRGRWVGQGRWVQEGEVGVTGGGGEVGETGRWVGQGRWVKHNSQLTHHLSTSPCLTHLPRMAAERPFKYFCEYFYVTLHMKIPSKIFMPFSEGNI